MKLFVALAIFTGIYLSMLLKTADTVLTQTEQLNTTYQSVVENSERIAAGQ